MQTETIQKSQSHDHKDDGEDWTLTSSHKNPIHTLETYRVKLSDPQQHGKSKTVEYVIDIQYDFHFQTYLVSFFTKKYFDMNHHYEIHLCLRKYSDCDICIDEIIQVNLDVSYSSYQFIGIGFEKWRLSLRLMHFLWIYSTSTISDSQIS